MSKEMEEAREAIAQGIYKHFYGNSKGWNNEYLDLVDHTLNLKRKDGTKILGVIAEDQKPPQDTANYSDAFGDQVLKQNYQRGQHEMIKAGWRRLGSE